MGWGLSLVGRRIISGLSLPLVRRMALVAALPVAGLSAFIFLQAGDHTLVSSGPIQSGHQALGCADCHERAPGTARQQIQATFRAAFSATISAPHFIYRPVTSETCLACHQRPNERHPIWRFREPRFQAATEIVDATSCLGCHSEHQAARVEVEPTFCRACHKGLSLKVDPLDVPHHQLIAANDWQSCLACHDFHGNHKAPPPRRLLEAHEMQQLLDYLKDGPDPFGEAKLYEARK